MIITSNSTSQDLYKSWRSYKHSFTLRTRFGRNKHTVYNGKPYTGRSNRVDAKRCK